MPTNRRSARIVPAVIARIDALILWCSAYTDCGDIRVDSLAVAAVLALQSWRAVALTPCAAHVGAALDAVRRLDVALSQIAADAEVRHDLDRHAWN